MKPCQHREAIARLAQNGEKASSISRRMKIPLRTVQRIVKQWKSTGNVTPKTSSGRPRSVNTRRVRGIIKKRVTRNDAVNMNSIAKDLNIARSTVQSIVKTSLGLRSYRVFKGQHLSDDVKLKRLTRSKEMLKMLKVHDILWTDEKIFTVKKAHNSQNDRQLMSPMQKNPRKRRIATKTPFSKGVMV